MADKGKTKFIANIAEEVIYMVEGEISRHRHDMFKPDDA